MKNNLLIVWSSGDVEVAEKFPLLYSSVVLDRKYWEKAHIMVWGPSILLAKQNDKIRKKLIEIQKTGVSMSACIVCTQEYEAQKELESLGIEVNHTGELFTKALKDDDWSVFTI